MSPRRRRLVIALIGALIGAHYVAIAGRIEQWPLSSYRMFARIRPPTASCLLLVGVTAEGKELPLQGYDYWRPHSGFTLARSLRLVLRQQTERAAAGSGASPLLPAASESLLAQYEARRRAGKHRGPPLAGLRLYAAEWRIEASLANLDHPDRKELLCEHFPSP
jgi:hypothetical protein